jgi:hypothetical protein
LVIGGINLEFHTGENRPTRNQSSTGTRSQDYERVGDFTPSIRRIGKNAMSVEPTNRELQTSTHAKPCYRQLTFNFRIARHPPAAREVKVTVPVGRERYEFEFAVE